MTVAAAHLSYYQKVSIFAREAAKVSECFMDVSMIAAIVNCALGEAWKHNLLLGGISFVATIGFGRCANRAEVLGGLTPRIILVTR